MEVVIMEQENVVGVLREEFEMSKLILFLVGDQEYCVSIENVCEICVWSEMIFFFNIVMFVCGVINFCGFIVLIVDVSVWLYG